MVLSSDNVKIIRLIADKLEKWAENLSYSVSQTENLWVELTLSLYPQNVEGLASWLANIPTTGQKAGKALEELSELVQKVDAWRNQGVYPEDLGDFCACINRLMKVTQNTISLLRDMSGSGESGPPPRLAPGDAGAGPPDIKAVTVEKSNTFEIQEMKPAISHPTCISFESLPTEALTAYKLHYEMGLTIQQVAKQMTKQLKLDKALRPFQ
ncbi:MAG: hypothetical protein JXA81_10315, partial [Sedimentisphaerales bacterium]|nr:hypothetical protein [Sedimentisphaerales bacterium]